MECFASVAIGWGLAVSSAVSVEQCRRLSGFCSASRSSTFNHTFAFTGLQRLRKSYGKELLKCDNWCKMSRILPIARAEYHKWNTGGHLAPLELQSSAGQLLSGILENQPDIFLFAATKQLEQLAADRDGAITRQELSASDAYSILHRFQRRKMCLASRAPPLDPTLYHGSAPRVLLPPDPCFEILDPKHVVWGSRVEKKA